jgi:hypothetical protein
MFKSIVTVVFHNIFTQKCIKYIFFIFFKLFLTLINQNDFKTYKNKFKIKNKNKFL